MRLSRPIAVAFLTATLGITGAAVAQPAQVSLGQIKSVAPGSYPFPGRADDLAAGQYWYWDREVHGSGNQRWGYDFSASRFDSRNKRWTRVKIDLEDYNKNKRNEDWIIYGKPVYAIAGGEVVRCWRNAPENPRPGESHPGRLAEPPTIPGGGNSLWIHQDDGKYVLYAHMTPGSIPASLCPISEQFMTDPTDADLPQDVSPRVEVGQRLGLVGNSGKSGNPHLHIHLQDGPPGSGKALVLRFNNTWVKPRGSDDSDKDWTRIDSKSYLNGPILILPDYAPGRREIARHAVPADRYQFVFNRIASSGYQLEWIDGFNSGGRIFFNVVFRPSDGKKSVAFHNLTAARYQEEFNKFTSQSYRLVHINSYPAANRVLYAAIFDADSGSPFTAHHGLSAAQHQNRFNELTGAGWRPKNISVTSINGQRSYAAVFERTNVGSYVARSFLTLAQYQQHFTENRNAGRQLAYLSAYEHNGEPHFSAIWNSVTKGAFKARHGLTSQQYQQEWEDALGNGQLTRAVTAYPQGNSVRYAAVWRR